MHPEGKYIVEITDAAITEAGTGTLQAAVAFKHETGELAGQPAPTYYGPLTENALEYTVKSLRACGFAGDDLDTIASIIGNKCQIVVQHDEYQGKTNAKVKFINKLGGIGAKKVLNDVERKSFAERMRAQISALSAGEKNTGEDEVPFEV